MLGLVGHLAHLPDKVGQPVNTVMPPVPDIAIRALTRVEGAAAEPVGEVRVVAQKNRPESGSSPPEVPYWAICSPCPHRPGQSTTNTAPCRLTGSVLRFGTLDWVTIICIEPIDAIFSTIAMRPLSLSSVRSHFARPWRLSR